MPINILMPALSPTMEKGNLAKWLKQEGEKVKPGDVIAEIETDKATMEYEVIDEGTLAKIVVPEGTQDVPVNALIAVLAEEGEDVGAAAAAAGDAGASKPPPTAKELQAQPSAQRSPSQPAQTIGAAQQKSPTRVPQPAAPQRKQDAGAERGVQAHRIFSSP